MRRRFGVPPPLKWEAARSIKVIGNVTFAEGGLRAAWPGRHTPLGATWDGEGTNFSLFSEHSEWVELVLFDPQGKSIASYELAEYTDLCWHGYIHGVGPGEGPRGREAHVDHVDGDDRGHVVNPSGRRRGCPG